MPHGDMSSDEVTITTDVVARLVAERFPRWAVLPVRPVPAPGVDNATYRLGDDMLVRLPRFERWVDQVVTEQRWLPILAPLLPLQIPEPLGRGEPTPEYPFPWSVYRWIEGERGHPDRCADPVRTAEDFAGFLSALWSLDTSGGPPPRWGNGFRGCAVGDERDSPLLESRIRGRIAEVDGLIDTAAATAVYESALAAPAWDPHPVWIHGDPAPGNLLCRDGRISAVIDFGTTAVADPACDLIAAWTWLTAPARKRLRDLLDVDDATWARGRAWGLTAVLPSTDPAVDPAAQAQALGRFDDLVADLATTG